MSWVSEKLVSLKLGRVELLMKLHLSYRMSLAVWEGLQYVTCHTTQVNTPCLNPNQKGRLGQTWLRTVEDDLHPLNFCLAKARWYTLDRSTWCRHLEAATSTWHARGRERGWYSIYLPWRDGRLSWPRLTSYIPRWFNLRSPIQVLMC